MEAILGMVMIYTTVHFLIIQHNNRYRTRTTYEKVVTWVGLTSIVLLYLAIMFG